MPDENVTKEQWRDELQDLIKRSGAQASQRLVRLSRLAADMQSLEWELLRKNGAGKRPSKDTES